MTVETAAGSERDEQLVSFSQIFEALLYRKWLIVIFVTVFAAVGLFVSYTSTPVYRSQVVVTYVQQQQSDNGLAGMFGSLGVGSLLGLEAGGSGKDEAVATMQSRIVSEAFIKSNGLIALFDPQTEPGLVGAILGNESEPSSLSDAFGHFDSKIRSLAEDPDTGLIRIRIDWTDKDQAAAWANDLVRFTNERIRSNAIEEAERSISYLNNELDKTSVVAQERAIFELLQQQINRIMIANVRDEYAFKVIDPAVPADIDNPVRPRKLMIMAAAILAGLIFGSLAALFLPSSLILLGRSK